MAQTAKIEYKGGISYTRRGKTYKRGIPQVVTSPVEIQQCKNTRGFSVVMLRTPAPDRKTGGRPSGQLTKKKRPARKKTARKKAPKKKATEE